MERVLIASKNKGKIEEFRHFFSKHHIEVESILDLNEDIEIIESGKTFEENALLKAHYLMNKTNKPVLADDSGLEVEALNNEPGVYSARYAGEHKNDLANIEKLLENLKDVPKEERAAHFVCCLALVTPDGEEILVRGTCYGLIIDEMRGNNGFGYDPIFYLPKYKKTFAELTQAEKERISHRGDALRKLEQYFL